MKAKSKGFSLPELITVVVVIAILGAITLAVISNLSATARENAKAANAALLTRLVQQAAAAGATAGIGATFFMDMSGAASVRSTRIIDLFNAGLVVNGLTFKLQPNISAAAIAAGSYSMSRYTSDIDYGVWSYNTGASYPP